MTGRGHARRPRVVGVPADCNYRGGMHTPTPTEVLDVVGRLEAEQEIPDAMRADVRLLGRLLGDVLIESGSEGLFEDV